MRPRALPVVGLVCIALATAAVAGCGFRLQGSAPLPPVLARTYLDTTDRYTDFYQSLAEGLDVAGARLVGTRGEASAVVELLRDETGQRVLSVSARNTPREYEVWYTVEYRVRAGERELLAPQTLTLATEYSFDETALLAKQQEQDQLRAALARDLAGQVIRRLAAIPPIATTTPAPAGAAAPATPAPSPPPAAAPPRP